MTNPSIPRCEIPRLSERSFAKIRISMGDHLPTADSHGWQLCLGSEQSSAVAAGRGAERVSAG